MSSTSRKIRRATQRFAYGRALLVMLASAGFGSDRLRRPGGDHDEPLPGRAPADPAPGVTVFVRLALAASILGLVLPSVASAADAPSASCTSRLTRLDRRIGETIPLPSSYSNPTSSTVTFKLRMTASYFFGPAHDIGTVTLPPHTGRIRATGLPTFLHTPLGGGYVTVEVRTDATGFNVIGRCDYQLHLSAPPAVDAGTPPRTSRRWLSQAPVQFCAIEGSARAGGARPGQMVPAGNMLKALAELNSSIWYPQAQIAFSTATDSAIPVIEDPTPPNGANGKLGDVTVAFQADGEQLATLCAKAWQQRFPGRRGIPVINARQFYEEPATLGVAPQPAAALYAAGRKLGSGARGDALCGSPVKLMASDIGMPFAILPDPSWQRTNAATLLAHELGHNLFLGHGNGLDDNADGRPAGFAGPRRYDEYCDPGWLAAPQNTNVAEDVGQPPCSLMQLFACSTALRPLQVETARGVAPFIPGFVDGTPVQVIG